MTRAEHLAWAKQRAHWALDHGVYLDGVASMLSDLGKHEETKASLRIGAALVLTVRDRPTHIPRAEDKPGGPRATPPPRSIPNR